LAQGSLGKIKTLKTANPVNSSSAYIHKVVAGGLGNHIRVSKAPQPSSKFEEVSSNSKASNHLNNNL
jgi:hypothetical protein